MEYEDYLYAPVYWAYHCTGDGSFLFKMDKSGRIVDDRFNRLDDYFDFVSTTPGGYYRYCLSRHFYLEAKDNFNLTKEGSRAVRIMREKEFPIYAGRYSLRGSTMKALFEKGIIQKKWTGMGYLYKLRNPKR